MTGRRTEQQVAIIVLRTLWNTHPRTSHASTEFAYKITIIITYVIRKVL